MRNPQFIAQHRGGPLPPEHHRLLAAWAADCAEHLLHRFTEHTADDRPEAAIRAARAWAAGTIPVGGAQRAAVAAHAAARAVGDPVATAIARAAGHAAATAHMAEHSLGAAGYALRALAIANESGEAEERWQVERLPGAVRELVRSAMQARRFRVLCAAPGRQKRPVHG